jgi:hypothetical protein
MGEELVTEEATVAVPGTAEATVPVTAAVMGEQPATGEEPTTAVVKLAAKVVVTVAAKAVVTVAAKAVVMVAAKAVVMVVTESRFGSDFQFPQGSGYRSRRTRAAAMLLRAFILSGWRPKASEKW